MNIRENIDVGKPDKIASFALLAQAAPQLVWTLIIAGTLGVSIAIWWLWNFLNLIAMCLSLLVLVLGAWKIVDGKIRAVLSIRRAKLALSKEQAQLEALKIKNERERARADLERYVLPQLVEQAIRNGHNFTYSAKGEIQISDWRSNIHAINSPSDTQVQEIPQLGNVSLPTNVRYEEVRQQIPEGHNLVGVGPNGVVTKEDRKIGACVWIVGLSGTGKTSTTSLRIEERAACGHQFLGYDPHWFKDDSLTNAIVGYADRFLMPMARSNDEALVVYDAFLTEFNNRKAGKVPKPFQKITIVVDEVNSLAEPEDEDEEGKKLLDKLKAIVRICGTEARNFNMGGLFISQKATRLYWIRDVALLIIVHKLLMENQQKLATNCDDKAFFAEMRLWPVGRTYVYGAGLESGEGCITVQQPYFEKAPVGNWNFEDRVIVEEEPVASDLDIVYEACHQLKERGMKVTVRSVAEQTPFEKTKVAELMNKLETQGCQIR